MQRELVCDILALAAPDSILHGYAQSWLNLVQAMQPGCISQEAATFTRQLAQHSNPTRLSFLVGTAAAPTLSQGIPGVPSAKLAGRVLMACTEANFKLVVPLLTGMLSAAPGATMAVVSPEMA